MPKVHFNFCGYASGNIARATTLHGQLVDVSNMTSQELVDKIRSGELYIDARPLIEPLDIEVTDYYAEGEV